MISKEVILDENYIEIYSCNCKVSVFTKTAIHMFILFVFLVLTRLAIVNSDPLKNIYLTDKASACIYDNHSIFPIQSIPKEFRENFYKLLTYTKQNEGVYFSSTVGFYRQSNTVHRVLAATFFKHFHSVIHIVEKIKDEENETSLFLDEGRLVRDDVYDPITFPIYFVAGPSRSYSIRLDMPDNVATLTLSDNARPLVGNLTVPNSLFILYNDLFERLIRFNSNNSCFIDMVKEIYETINHSALAFFSSKDGNMREIAFFYRGRHEYEACLEVIHSLKPHKVGRVSRTGNYKGFGVAGYCYQIGLHTYYLCVLVNQKNFLIRGPEKAFTTLMTSLMIKYYEQFVMDSEEDYIQTLNDILRDSKYFSIYEKDQDEVRHVLGQMHDNEDTEEIAALLKKESSYIRNGTHTITLEDKRTYHVKTIEALDDGLDRTILSMLVFDVTAFSIDDIEIKNIRADIDLATKFFGLHRLVNQTTLINDSLSLELGYDVAILSLLDLVAPEDAFILHDISPGKQVNFRLRDSCDQHIWYSAVSTETPSGAFLGYVFCVQEVTNLRSILTSDSIQKITSDILSFFTVDSKTGDVFDSVWVGGPLRNVSEIVSLLSPEDHIVFKNAIAKASKLQTITFPVQMKLPNRPSTYYQMTVSGFTPKTLIIVALNIGKQQETVNELEATEELTVMAFYHSNVVRWVFDDTNSPTRVFTSGPLNFEPLRLNWSSIHHNVSEEFSPQIKQTFKEALKTGEPFEIEFPVFFEQMRWLHMRGIRSINSNQLIGFYFDLTELREASRQLDKQRKHAQEAISAKSRFLANLSHEIRTPLNGMFGFLELLTKTNTDPQNAELLEILQTSFARLSELLNDTLDLAKMDQAKMTPSIRIFNPVETMEPLFSALYEKCRGAGIATVFDVDASFPKLIEGDDHIMSRILFNLVSNAIKFTLKGHVNMHATLLDDNSIGVVIEDTGIGIPPERQAAIYDMFTQLDSSVTRPYGGTGIGLSLVKRMIDLIGGKINLESDPGKGTKVSVVLPYKAVCVPYIAPYYKAKPATILVICPPPFSYRHVGVSEFYGVRFIYNVKDVDETMVLAYLRNTPDQFELIKDVKERFPEVEYTVIIDKHDETVPEGFTAKHISCLYSHFRSVFEVKGGRGTTGRKHETTTTPEKLKKLRVLVAEDNKMSQLLMEKVMARFNYTFKIASNGVEVLKLLEQQEFDVILMDQNMPVMDGPTVTRRIRSSGLSYSSIPIIAMTASIMKEDEDECMSSGMDYYISKPISIDKLKKVIQKVLQHKLSE